MKKIILVPLCLMIASVTAFAADDVEAREKILDTKIVKIGQCETSYWADIVGVRILVKVVNKKLVYLVARSGAGTSVKYIENSSRVMEVSSLREERWFSNDQFDNRHNCEDYRGKLLFQSE